MPCYITVTLIALLCFLVISGSAQENDEFRNHPTTRAPTTPAPTTKAPTTKAPTTHAPTTKAPTTAAPTTHAPTTQHESPHWPTDEPTHEPVTPRPTHAGHGNPQPRPTRPFSPPIYNTPYEEANLNVTRALYDGLIFPNALNIITAGVYPAGLFSNATSGRITPVGVFGDQQGSFEYFYGLASSQVLTTVNFIHLIAKGNLVIVRVDLLFNLTAGPQNLTQEGFIFFDSENRVVSYDLVILRLGAFIGFPTPAEQPYIIEEICEVHEYYCLGANQQYADFDTCVAQISSMNFGNWDNASSNTTTCRELHSLLVPLRPAFHCPHIGPAGGGVCIDEPYADYYLGNDYY